MSNERLSRLGRLMQEHGLDAVALNPGPTFAYLTSISFHLMERPIVALFAPDRQPWLVLPEFERTKAEAGPIDFHLVTYGEGETSRPRVHTHKGRSGPNRLSSGNLRRGRALTPQRLRAGLGGIRTRLAPCRGRTTSHAGTRAPLVGGSRTQGEPRGRRGGAGRGAAGQWSGRGGG